MRIIIIAALAALSAFAQPRAQRLAGSLSIEMTVYTGTGAPSSGDCDAAAEVGRIYLRSTDPATANARVSVCRQTGASSYAWHPISHFVGLTAALPAACADGDVAFVTDGTSGQNWKGCLSNAWVTMSGSSDVASVFGRTGAVTAGQDDYFPTQLGCSYSVSGATLTLFPNASATKPCNFGGVQKTAPVTVTVSSASTTGTARVFVDVTGAVQVYYNTGATLTCGSGATCTSGQSAFPGAGEVQLFTPTWTASNTWDAYAAVNDLRPILGTPRTAVCTGCTATSYSNDGRTFNFTVPTGSSIASTSSVLKGDGAGAAVAATAGTDYVSPSSTETLTNKALSWASSSIGLRDWESYRLAVCRGGGAGTATLGDAISTPASGAATPVCLGGTNQVMGGLRFADSGTNEVQITYRMADDDTATQNYMLLWKTSATTGAVKWQVSQACITVGTGTIDIAWEHTPTTTTSVLAAANAVQSTTVNGGNNGCGAGQLKTIRIFRDPTDVADTAGADVDLLTFNIFASRVQ